MTTNAGSNLNLNSLGFATVEQSKLDSQRTEKALSDFLRPEFLNRVDEIITFRQLDEGDFVKIAKLMLDDLAKALSERGIKLGHTDAAAEFIAKSSFSTKYGARNMRRYIQRNVEDAIANIIVSDVYKRQPYLTQVFPDQFTPATLSDTIIASWFAANNPLTLLDIDIIGGGPK